MLEDHEDHDDHEGHDHDKGNEPIDMRTISEKCLSKSESFGQSVEGVSTAFDHSAFI